MRIASDKSETQFLITSVAIWRLVGGGEGGRAPRSVQVCVVDSSMKVRKIDAKTFCASSEAGAPLSQKSRP